MTSIDDPAVRALLDAPNHAVLSTTGADGSVHSAVVWVDVEDGKLAVNSAVGRRWPTDLERDPRTTLVVVDEENPYHYVEIRGTATSRLEGADAHIDRLAKKYLGADRYPGHSDAETRITYLVEPRRVRVWGS
ncbi:PPOX class F420-dependent oxidoreductase [Kineococcus glutinatus]|uniref:PPOX class F420-dependent oxidoreductase n=1 Tax=Kineococcus glutinatus TaxID=1070872 RepID=A0ABP9HXL7_9ACTN